MEWQPSFCARLFRKTGSWILKIENNQLVVPLDDQASTTLKYQRGLLWLNLKLWSGRELHLVGPTHSARTELDQHLHAASSRHKFRLSYAKIINWLKKAEWVYHRANGSLSACLDLTWRFEGHRLIQTIEQAERADPQGRRVVGREDGSPGGQHPPKDGACFTTADPSGACPPNNRVLEG